MKNNHKEEKCPNRAEAIVPWAGKIMKGCLPHCRNMATLGVVIGNPVEIRTLPPTLDNCEFNNDL